MSVIVKNLKFTVLGIKICGIRLRFILDSIRIRVSDV